MSLQDRATRTFIPAPDETIVGGASGRIRRMSFTLEFPDSEVRDVVADGALVRLRFSAASVRGADGGRGWLPAVLLTLSDATLAGDAAHAFGKIADGGVRLDGRLVARLELPATLAGELELALRFANGTHLAARGRALSLSVADDTRFAEDLAC
jgi:hypothetical protein